jgi:hypothetical protein
VVVSAYHPSYTEGEIVGIMVQVGWGKRKKTQSQK